MNETKPVVKSKTVWVGLVIGLLPVILQYLAEIDWTQYVPAEYAPTVIGGIMIALRFVTATGVGGAK